MTTRDPSTYTAGEIAHPSVDAATLAQVASLRPDLWASILANPNCYPELAQWIQQQQPGILPQQVATSGYAQPVAATQGQLAPAAWGAPTTGSGYADAAQPAATFEIRPAARAAIFVVLGAAALTLVSFFLPRFSLSSEVRGLLAGYGGDTVDMPNILSEGGGRGYFLLILIVATIGLGAATLATKKDSLRKATGIVGLVAGVLVFFEASWKLLWSSAASTLSFGTVTTGFGVFLFAIGGVALIVGGIIALAKGRKQVSAAPQYHYQ